MECSSDCMNCLASKQFKRIQEFKDEGKKKEFLTSVYTRIGNVNKTDTAPYLSYLFDKKFEQMFDTTISYTKEKDRFNALVLQHEEQLKKKIYASSDPLETSILFSMIGNYIDFGAMDDVDEDVFLHLFDQKMHLDQATYAKFQQDLKTKPSLLLLCDNCGEVVLDRFVMEVIHEQYPNLKLYAMVKKDDVLNDATMEDAKQAGLDTICTMVTTGNGIAGCDDKLIDSTALKALQSAGCILSKGQANFETLYKKGYNAYFAFLCKCDYFAKRFDVKKFTGMFLHESYKYEE